LSVKVTNVAKARLFLDWVEMTVKAFKRDFEDSKEQDPIDITLEFMLYRKDFRKGFAQWSYRVAHRGGSFNQGFKERMQEM